MTVLSVYKEGLEKLASGGVEDFAFDCECLFETATGLSRTQRILNPDSVIDTEIYGVFMSYIDRRISGEPLQYILGKWNFTDLEFTVGEGVLIPRPETEMLAEETEKLIFSDGCVVYDLCAGSGAIGLSIAKHRPECDVYLFEKYERALEYLNINNGKLSLCNTHIISCDVLNGCPDGIPKADIIVSNPPYVKRDEISFLQKEVGREPVTALDGGEDGLDFYRAICDKWLSMVKKDGYIILECADNQSSQIMEIFREKTQKSEVVYDFNNIDRIVKIKV